MKYSISTDKSMLDVKTIHDFLCNRSYWAKGRSIEQVKESIDNSMCFGLYEGHERMLGFARVVTDKVVFAYLMDVFILEDNQGKGLGTMLVKHIVEHPDLQVRFCLLATADGHDFYKNLGFEELSETERYLAITNEFLC